MAMIEPAPTRPHLPKGPGAGQPAEILAGRKRAVRELLGLLIAERIVLLHGPVGSGKTAVLQEALLPQLAAREFTVLPLIRVNLDPSASPATLGGKATPSPGGGLLAAAPVVGGATTRFVGRAAT